MSGISWSEGEEQEEGEISFLGPCSASPHLLPLTLVQLHSRRILPRSERSIICCRDMTVMCHYKERVQLLFRSSVGQIARPIAGLLLFLVAALSISSTCVAPEALQMQASDV